MVEHMFASYIKANVLLRFQ